MYIILGSRTKSFKLAKHELLNNNLWSYNHEHYLNINILLISSEIMFENV